jgi:Transposase IS4
MSILSVAFSPDWIYCVDESISVWTDMWTCPGWMFVPRKPHPIGNEYHSLCCGVSGVMYTIELVEGKIVNDNCSLQNILNTERLWDDCFV